MASCLFFLAGLFSVFYNKDKFSRDEVKLKDTYAIIQAIPAGSVINIHPGMWEDWSLHGYYARLKGVSLDPDLNNMREYLLIRNDFLTDTTRIRNYKKVVAPEDTVYIVGDLTLAGEQHQGYVLHLVNQLHGRKIFIFGNHDKLNPFTYIELGFESAHTSLDTGKYILCHDPATSIVLPNRRWLCGHVHILFKKLKNVVNVGVDQWGYFPVNEVEIDKLFEDVREKI